MKQALTTLQFPKTTGILEKADRLAEMLQDELPVAARVAKYVAVSRALDEAIEARLRAAK